MSKSKRRKSSRSHVSSGGAVSVGGKAVNTFWLAVIAVVLVAAAGFLIWRSWQGAGGVGSAPLADAVGVQVGQVAPDFIVPTLDGSSFTLAGQRGKPTIIFFMAYWCSTCIPEARALTRLQQEYGEQLSIIAIDLDPSSTPEALSRFKSAADNGDYIWAFDTSQQVANALQVQALDTTLILDSEGRIVYRDAYPTTYDILKETLADLGL